MIGSLGGSSIQQECADYIRKNGQMMDGQVFTSSPGHLSCKKIIHAVGPRWKDGFSQEEQTLYACIDNCFDETRRQNLHSIAIPPISTGIFGYPLGSAVKTIVEVVADREKNASHLPQKIIFVDNKENSLTMFENALRDQFSQSEPSAPIRSERGELITCIHTSS